MSGASGRICRAAGDGTTITTAGFTLHSGDGEIVAYAEHFDAALRESRRNDVVSSIRRVLDDVEMAFKPSKRRRQSVEEYTLRVAS